MTIADIEIFGGGILGLSTAYSCARRGYKVRVIEKRHIGSGASGGLLGALAPHVPENWNQKKQFQFDSLKLAKDWWAEATDIGGIQSTYIQSGRIQPIGNSRLLQLAKNRRESAQEFWQGFAEWNIIPSSGEWMPQSSTGMVIFDTLSAMIDPKSSLACLEAAILALGGEILEGCSEGKGAEIKVHATGYEGLIKLSHELGSEFGGSEKGQAALLKFDACDVRQIFAEGIHIIPRNNGTVAVGSTSERKFDKCSETNCQLDDLINRAKNFVPPLQDAPILSRWSGIRPRSANRSPILGPYPGKPEHFIANGGFKIGFGIAPLASECLADLMLNEHCRIPEIFLPQAIIAANTR